MLRTQIAAAIGCARGTRLMKSCGRFGRGTDRASSAMTRPGSFPRSPERRGTLQGSRQTALSTVFPPRPSCPTPVRRRSYFKGRSEGRIWQATTRKDVQAILKAAEIYNEAGLHEKRAQRPARIGGARRAAAVRQPDRLPHRPARAVNHHDHGPFGPVAGYDRAGAEEPAGAWLHRLAAALRADRERGRGPQVQQASNAYRLSLPEKARQFLAGSARPRPRLPIMVRINGPGPRQSTPTGRPCPLMSGRSSTQATGHSGKLLSALLKA